MCTCILVGSQFESHGLRTLKNRHMDKTHIQERGRAATRPVSISFKGQSAKLWVLHLMAVPYSFQVDLTPFKLFDYHSKHVRMIGLNIIHILHVKFSHRKTTSSNITGIQNILPQSRWSWPTSRCLFWDSQYMRMSTKEAGSSRASLFSYNLTVRLKASFNSATTHIVDF